jgi:hypothetical protein
MIRLMNPTKSEKKNSALPIPSLRSRLSKFRHKKARFLPIFMSLVIWNGKNYYIAILKTLDFQVSFIS